MAGTRQPMRTMAIAIRRGVDVEHQVGPQPDGEGLPREPRPGELRPATGGGGTLKSYEAPGDDNVAWASDLSAGRRRHRELADGVVRPAQDVPHLVARTTVTADAVDVYVDFRPRAAVGYETALPDGSFPEPDSRDAFMARGKRDDLEKRFYGGLRDWRAGVAGAPKPAPASETEALMRSPVAVDVSLPAGADSVATAAALCADAAKTFLAWTAEDHAL
ncbi:hypothetical protein JL722_12940 [Aureococcus anophagefferens]|nr:hypothetical protein JL722_12940 [Aureococcus anophagefferens]